MFTRSILIPSLVVCAIAAPIMFSQAKRDSGPIPSPAVGQNEGAANGQNGFARMAGFDSSGNAVLPNAQADTRIQLNRYQPTNAPNYQTAPLGNPNFQQVNAYGNPAATPPPRNQPSRNGNYIPNSSPVLPPAATASGFDPATLIENQSPSNWPPSSLPFDGMTPDYGAAQTVIYPGNAYGPDFSAAPLEFMPVTNFEEIFRFNITTGWIKNRWSRVSTSPGDRGLHGLRVALVTGTNSWDLHGSLTYFFDGNQQLQRITFRGWGGDATKLIDLLTQKYGFKTQPTHWAGFYLAENKRKPTGGILMQYPTVIYSDNTVQQIAVVLEINNPQSNFSLSEEFQSLIAGSMRVR